MISDGKSLVFYACLLQSIPRGISLNRGKRRARDSKPLFLGLLSGVGCGGVAVQCATGQRQKVLLEAGGEQEVKRGQNWKIK